MKIAENPVVQASPYQIAAPGLAWGQVAFVEPIAASCGALNMVSFAFNPSQTTRN